MAHTHLRLAAEWERQSGVQLTWPHEDTDWKPYLAEITATFIELAREIAHREPLLIVARDANGVSQLLHERLGGDLCRNISYFECDTNDTWARDHGAITLIGDNERRILDFKFNGWGEKFAWEHDNAITRRLFQAQRIAGSYEEHTDFVLEGGSIESDGRGTVFTTSHCLLADHRNQPLSRIQIEQELLRRLRAQRIVWLDHGTLIGDDTDGHIDTIVRLAPDDTLLYIRCDDEADSHYADFQRLERQLQSLTTPSGKPYRLIPLPLPDAIYYDGERLPATYANFLVVNGAVIYPTYGQPKKDMAAKEAIAKAFKDRKVVGVDSRVIIRQHGSIHCLTMQFPADAANGGRTET